MLSQPEAVYGSALSLHANDECTHQIAVARVLDRHHSHSEKLPSRRSQINIRALVVMDRSLRPGGNVSLWSQKRVEIKLTAWRSTRVLTFAGEGSFVR